jgi:hypothetical protein
MFCFGNSRIASRWLWAFTLLLTALFSLTSLPSARADGQVPVGSITQRSGDVWLFDIDPSFVGAQGDWEILDPLGNIVATNYQPNGWAVGFDDYGGIHPNPGPYPIPIPGPGPTPVATRPPFIIVDVSAPIDTPPSSGWTVKFIYFDFASGFSPYTGLFDVVTAVPGVEYDG